MQIPAEVLREFGINKENKKRGMKFPKPFINYDKNGILYKLDAYGNRVKQQVDNNIINLQDLVKQTQSKTYILNNLDSNRCDTSHLFSLEAYDRTSVENGKFLLENINNVNVLYGKYNIELFDRMFIYDECNHLLYLKVYNETIKCVSDRPTLFNKCKFIPLIHINMLESNNPMTESITYLDMLRNPKLSLKLFSYTDRVNNNLVHHKFYFVRRSKQYGLHLACDTTKGKMYNLYNALKERDLLKEKLTWREIKSDYLLRSGLDIFLGKTELELDDDAMYTVCVNYEYNMLWLKPEK